MNATLRTERPTHSLDALQQRISAKTQLGNERIAAIIGGPVALVLFGIGWFGFCRLVPPPAATHSAAYIINLYRHHETRMMTGIIITTFAGCLMGLWTTLLSLHMRRIEGRWGLLSLAQLIFGGMVTIEFIIPGIILLEPAFRTNLPPSTVQAIWDIGMLFFMQPSYTLVIEGMLLAVAILQDRGQTPIFPRWSGYLSLALAVFSLIFLVNPFFKTGPLSWNGLVGWWLAAGAYFVSVVIETIFMLKAGYSGQDVGMAMDDYSGDVYMASEVQALRAEVAAVRRMLGTA